MQIKNLSNIPFSQLVEAFLIAFEGYYVKMPTDMYYYAKRWKISQVDYALSYGMFDGEKLIGFIIHAIGYRNNKKIAFNTGTGVVPTYRGRKIVQQLYNYAIPLLKENGIQNCQLEVIQKNLIALKLYQKIGFKISKNYYCFDGIINVNNDKKCILQLQKLTSKVKNELINQETYSWDNQFEILINGDYQFYILERKKQKIAYFIINSEKNYVAQCDVYENTNENWAQLFHSIQKISPRIRINNVDADQTAKVNALKSIGLQHTVSQYEMLFSLE